MGFPDWKVSLDNLNREMMYETEFPTNEHLWIWREHGSGILFNSIPNSKIIQFSESFSTENHAQIFTKRSAKLILRCFEITNLLLSTDSRKVSVEKKFTEQDKLWRKTFSCRRKLLPLMFFALNYFPLFELILI